MEEIYDLVDENNQPTGLAKSKSLVHKEGDWHRTSHVWVMNRQGELLLQKRSLIKPSWPGYWDISVGGHVRAGEDPLDAAVREVEEEVGIKASPNDLEFLFVIQDGGVTNEGSFIENDFHYVYLLRTDHHVDKFTPDPKEVAEVRYIYYKNLRQELASHPEKFVPHKEYEPLFNFLEKVNI